ncbi:hypothetical protein J7400_01300 [Shimia sp. R9_2]|uniref:hypothetical protein n=1 Tax=Shimia sp. R9_2 TaxID=2821112 RepID=UPI001AD9B3EC|nr:hypothetical protein [Shimia sp. R9_2]MBO9395297.1 hypothetical protein [Shimia sp. R9_2]
MSKTVARYARGAVNRLRLLSKKLLEEKKTGGEVALSQEIRTPQKNHDTPIVTDWGQYQIPQRHKGKGPLPSRLDTPALLSLKNRHFGERCFVVGNGPSLTTTDLDALRWEYTFGSNKIYLAFPETHWRPTFYSLEDRLVMEQNQREIIGIEQTIKLMPEYTYKYMGDDPSVVYFRFPHICDPRKPLESKDFPGFSINAEHCVYWGSTIVYTQIQLAAHMGFKEIYLIGIDHSYETPKKMENGAYVYSGEKNHFSKDYRRPGEVWNKPQLEVLEHSYRAARTACEEHGIKIRNASRKTALDVFERADLDEVISGF